VRFHSSTTVQGESWRAAASHRGDLAWSGIRTRVNGLGEVGFTEVMHQVDLPDERGLTLKINLVRIVIGVRRRQRLQQDRKWP
jgi:hypothetical protein